ncbi:MAG: PD-(D/E)XK nuclease-like domain-containing protein [Nitrosomonas sp.]|nr:PD-(D/E)XK nuclease-like domain-containing protein [Nitrosomonas sp.]
MSRIIQDALEVYHADRDYVSSTPLRAMEKSPLHFFTDWKSPEQKEPTTAMIKGQVLHSLLLEQSVDKYIARPVKDDGSLVRSNSKEYLAFLEQNPGKIPIEPELFANLYMALERFIENKTAMDLCKDAAIETSIYTADQQTRIKIKARPDIWGSDYIVDLKTTGQLDRFFERNIFNNGFDVQLAHYAECIEAAGRPPIKNAYIIAFEQSAPYQSKVYRLGQSELKFARNTWRGYMNEISLCLKENTWPGFPSEIIDVSRPEYLNHGHGSTDIFQGAV